MNENNWWLRKIKNISLFLMMGFSITANAGLFGFDSVTWKEEVLLHDGQKIIVERSQSYGGRHEIGQSQPVKEQEISFTVPGTNKAIIFKSEFSEDVGRANFKLVALHIINGTPYIVTVPNLCLSYNKWGRPNPPYVIFKHENNEWKRIALPDLPMEFNDINLVVNNKGEERITTAQSIVSAELVRKLNGELTQKEYKTILREPYPTAMAGCGELIRTNHGWEGLGFFEFKKTYEACLKYCDQKGVNELDCPCKRLFNGEKQSNDPDQTTVGTYFFHSSGSPLLRPMHSQFGTYQRTCQELTPIPFFGNRGVNFHI